MIKSRNSKRCELEERSIRLSKIFKYLFFLSSISLLLNFALTFQSIKKEKIIALIGDLTPSNSIKKSFKNIDIIGYDILNENKRRLTSSKFKFYKGNKFYLVLYGKRKISEGLAPRENKLGKCKAVLEHQKRGYFWSMETTFHLGKKKIEESPQEWEIGGIYKIRFTFIIPEFALPGKYKLKIVNEKSALPNVGRLRIFDKIKITTKCKKTHKSEKIEDYNLPLESCLLNPAIQRSEHIYFPHTGNIEFFIDKDLRNFQKIIITARGTLAFGVYPLLKTYVHQKEIGSVYVNGDWKQYEFDLKLDKESHILKVRFDNDGKGPGENRNMYVKMIKLVR